jgi:membrane protein DedA with SNARE-associated domain
MQTDKGKLRKKAPQIVLATIALALIAYVSVEILADVLIEGTPITSEPIIGAIITFTGNVTDTIYAWGYIGIFALMILEASSLPIPSEIVLPFAGCMISTGANLDFTLTVVIATVGAVIGSLIDYYIGYKGVETLTKHRILGHSLFSMQQLETAGNWFRRYGSAVVFLARLVPLLRTLISFPAGAAKMSLPKFVAYTAAGCLIWNTLLIYVGYYLGVNWRQVAGINEYILIAVVAVFAVAAILYLTRRKKRRKQAQTPNAGA